VVLLVDDDARIRRTVGAGLRLEGFEVVPASGGRAALAAVEQIEPAVMLLDMAMPDLDGLEVLRRLRGAGHDLPVCVLSARDEIGDRVAGLEAGADDYVVKPFQLEELAARLRALVRRAHGEAAPILAAAGVTLDPGTRTVAWQGRQVDLPAREFDVLHELMLNAGRVLSREHLQGRVYRWGEEVESNAIDVHIHHLRRKLAPALIRTIRGVGYLMPREDDD
jgi:two-component system OmpR family response regulator/two-component system response regulator QseB